MEAKIVFSNYVSNRKIFKRRKKTLLLNNGGFTYSVDKNFSFKVTLEDVEKINIDLIVLNGMGETKIVASQRMVIGMHFGYEYELNGVCYKFNFAFK